MLVSEFETLLKNTESTKLEFKQAKTSFSFDKLLCYCAALCNNEGGHLVLGVTDDRKVCGTNVYRGTLHELPIKIYRKVGIGVQAEEMIFGGKRVVIFFVPKHFAGRPVSVDGKYYDRLGSSLIEMSVERLKMILLEVEPDFSAEVCNGATIDDLDKEAINKMRRLIAKKMQSEAILRKTDKQILTELRLMDGKVVKYAAIILLGTEQAVAKYIPSSEIIFEWRQDSDKISYDYRKVWRRALIFSCDEVWEEISARNIRYDTTDGLFKGDIWAFNPLVIREAIINAVAHRSYQMPAHSVWVRASSGNFEVESPGGLVAGITIENIFEKSAWRNRLLADTFQRIGWMDQSSQGMDTIFQMTIEEGKGAPSIKAEDDSVSLSINVTIVDRNFVGFVNRMITEKNILLSTQEIIELDKIRMNNGLHAPVYKDTLLQKGLIELQGRGTAAMYFLTKDYYQLTNELGVYTRIKGLSADAKRALILKHLKDNGRITSRDLELMFPELSYQQRYNLMRPFISDGKVLHNGDKKTGYWCLVACQDNACLKKNS